MVQGEKNWQQSTHHLPQHSPHHRRVDLDEITFVRVMIDLGRVWQFFGVTKKTLEDVITDFTRPISERMVTVYGRLFRYVRVEDYEIKEVDEVDWFFGWLEDKERVTNQKNTAWRSHVSTITAIDR